VVEVRDVPAAPAAAQEEGVSAEHSTESAKEEPKPEE
jgi:hypothetical protein